MAQSHSQTLPNPSSAAITKSSETNTASFGEARSPGSKFSSCRPRCNSPNLELPQSLTTNAVSHPALFPASNVGFHYHAMHGNKWDSYGSVPIEQHRANSTKPSDNEAHSYLQISDNEGEG